MPAPPTVEFRDVHKRYGGGPSVLADINFTAEAGDFVALIGPSGCGKSTLLRLVAGLSPLTSGLIAIDGSEPEATGRNLAFIFQDPTLLPWLTAAKNVEVPLRLRHASAAQRAERREKALALVGLAGREEAYPRQLSGGQKMRVSIARALSIAPNLLLLDEPFGALDEITREHLNEELLAIRQRETWTAFFVTHSVAEAVFLSNRLVVLSANPGRIHREVRIGLPYPRTADTRQSRDYQQLVAEVSGLLRSVETIP
ncbi:MAG: ABC transporter ATP-binding protein [Opitutaceae bacterium]|jgi:NitT/TauT family transport system ATP-binding protein